jgi:membrane-bound lytic murein transglycosylase D
MSKGKWLLLLLWMVVWSGCTSTIPYNNKPASTAAKPVTKSDIDRPAPDTPLGLHASIKLSADAVVEAYLAKNYEQAKYELESLLRLMDPLPLDSRADKINHLDKYYAPLDANLTFAIINDDLRWRKVTPSQPVVAPPPAASDPDVAEVPDKLFAETASSDNIKLPEIKKGSYFEKGLHRFIQKEIRDVAVHMGEPVNFKLPDDFVKEIEYYIRRFQNEPYYQKFFMRSLRRSRKYIPALRDIFQEKGFPEEIMYLAFIESGFNPVAYSRSHAAGLFQFIKSTGRQYGLKINRSIDERYSPYRSAVACREYLHDLLLELGSFTLALSSYNSGSGKTRQALRRLNNFKDRSFWALREQTNVLKHETREYVPQIFAAIVMAKPGNPPQFGFEDVPFPTNYDVVVVPRKVSLLKIASETGLSLNDILALNPDLEANDTHTPSRVLDYPLFVPRGSKERVEAALDKIFGGSAAVATNDGNATYHTVRRGESLWLIAKKYRTTVTNIKRLNGLKSNYIKAGQRLIVKSGSSAATPRLADVPKPRTQTVQYQSVIKQQNIRRGETFLYAVTAGNTLSEIADRFSVTVDQIKRWNGLRSNTLKVGQRLKIIAQKDIQYYQYKVKSGDTLSEIAKQFGGSEEFIRFTNGKHSSLLVTGEVLKIFVF